MRTHARIANSQWSHDAHKQTTATRSRDAHKLTHTRARIAHSQWSRDAHKQTRKHTYARTQAHAHPLTVNGHVMRTSKRARTHMQGHKHTRTFIGHVMRTSTRASLTVNGHVTCTHTYARTQANADRKSTR